MAKSKKAKQGSTVVLPNGEEKPIRQGKMEQAEEPTPDEEDTAPDVGDPFEDDEAEEDDLDEPEPTTSGPSSEAAKAKLRTALAPPTPEQKAARRAENEKLQRSGVSAAIPAREIKEKKVPPQSSRVPAPPPVRQVASGSKPPEAFDVSAEAEQALRDHHSTITFISRGFGGTTQIQLRGGRSSKLRGDFQTLADMFAFVQMNLVP